ncbi:MAG TPA: hypothetical protein VL332_07285 [Candidatus Saccharimonadaceae bacterium]|nr:hypothetical protein [Candidatus Saccharimonadaceae bacterium]
MNQHQQLVDVTCKKPLQVNSDSGVLPTLGGNGYRGLRHAVHQVKGHAKIAQVIVREGQGKNEIAQPVRMEIVGIEGAGIK